jgi:hypothetical protein
MNADTPGHKGPMIFRSRARRSATAVRSRERWPVPRAQWWATPEADQASVHSPGSQWKSTREVVLPICRRGAGDDLTFGGDQAEGAVAELAEA